MVPGGRDATFVLKVITSREMWAPCGFIAHGNIIPLSQSAFSLVNGIRTHYHFSSVLLVYHFLQGELMINHD